MQPRGGARRWHARTPAAAAAAALAGALLAASATRAAEAGGRAAGRATHFASLSSASAARAEARRAARRVRHLDDDRQRAAAAVEEEPLCVQDTHVDETRTHEPERTYLAGPRGDTDVGENTRARALRFYDQPPPSPATYTVPPGDGGSDDSGHSYEYPYGDDVHGDGYGYGHSYSVFQDTCGSLPMESEVAYSLSDEGVCDDGLDPYTYIRGDTRTGPTGRVVIPANLALDDLDYMNNHGNSMCQRTDAWEYECKEVRRADNGMYYMVTHEAARPTRNAADDLLRLQNATSYAANVSTVMRAKRCNASSVVVTEVNLGHYTETPANGSWTNGSWTEGPTDDFVPAYVELKNVGDEDCRLERWQLTAAGLSDDTTMAISFSNHVIVPSHGTLLACHFHAGTVSYFSDGSSLNMLGKEACYMSVVSDDMFRFDVDASTVIELRAPTDNGTWETKEYALANAGAQPIGYGESVAFCEQDSNVAVWLRNRSPWGASESDYGCIDFFYEYGQPPPFVEISGDVEYECYGYGCPGALSAVVTSLNHPSDYGDNQDGTILIDGPANYSFTAFDLESHPFCVYDDVSVEGTKYCGTQAPPAGTVAPNEQLTITFKTDGSVTRSGFRLAIYGDLADPPEYDDYHDQNYSDYNYQEYSEYHDQEYSDYHLHGYGDYYDYGYGDYHDQNYSDYNYQEYSDYHDQNYSDYNYQEYSDYHDQNYSDYHLHGYGDYYDYGYGDYHDQNYSDYNYQEYSEYHDQNYSDYNYQEYSEYHDQNYSDYNYQEYIDYHDQKSQ